MRDTNGREYAKFSEVKPGTKLESDGGFSCLRANEDLAVYKDRNGYLSVLCDEGHHNLEGQLSDDGKYYVGLYLK